MATHLVHPSASAAGSSLVPGPRWSSFEQFRKGGETSLDEIPEHGVATLVAKRGSYRVLRDSDFQTLVGHAADVRRLQQGLSLVIKAARVVAKHNDEEHRQLLLESVSMIAGSPVLPTRNGHDGFQLTEEELESSTEDDFDFEHAVIPRPQL